ncbi:MAG TPA: glycogen debranching enzyme N-terminal domain-containing protein, partial [Thermoanaerobaculia bacterium]|nr:glycogen debranching enzyme N-terminal domain-containing protein [Thermoanaerobaculia bacterium]
MAERVQTASSADIAEPLTAAVPDLVEKVEAPGAAGFARLLAREWLVTNGLGGYASGTVLGLNSWRYHGLFVPSLPSLGRVIMISRLREEID